MKEKIVIPEIEALRVLEKERGEVLSRPTESYVDLLRKSSELSELNQATNKECTALRYQQAQVLNLKLGGEN